MPESQRSWDLKVQRAERHLDEVKAAMSAYASRNPYRAARVRQPKGQRHVWLYRLEMAEEPDPMIPVIIGERLYDLRSALDHLAVAMAPRKRKANAAFPVETTDPWEKDAAGNFAYPDERRRCPRSGTPTANSRTAWPAASRTSARTCRFRLPRDSVCRRSHRWSSRSWSTSGR
jgi:hypothetical protein